MYIIVGLGNPGKEYKDTRHNVGFDVIDCLADRAGISVLEKKHKALIGKGLVAGQKCILVKPQTYMNLSGASVGEVVDYYKVDPASEVIVISDDVSLAVGQIRIRKKGSAGGHNGLKDIIARLGSGDFIRVRMGVGEKPEGYQLADYVLGHFGKEDRKQMDEAARRAAEAIEKILRDGVDIAMNEYNRRPAE